MNISNYYWYFSGVLTPRFCDEVIKHDSLIIGGNSQNNTIDFGTDDKIIFDIDNTLLDFMYMKSNSIEASILEDLGFFVFLKVSLQA